MKKLLIIGGGEHARVVIETALASKQWEVIGFLDYEECAETQKITGLNRLGNDCEVDRILKEYSDLEVILGIGHLSARAKVLREFIHLALNWATIIHPDSYISNNVTVKQGTVVFAKAIIQANAYIGEQVIINTGAIIEHDCSIEDYSHISSGVVMGGGVSIGNNSLIGIGSKIRDHLTIGENVTVGSGSVVVSDISQNSVVVGVPAKEINCQEKKHIQISELCISPKMSIQDAMSILAVTGENVVFVTDEKKILLGILTTGDVRNALLSGIEIEAPVESVMNKEFTFVDSDLPRYMALQLMKSKNIKILPILNEEKVILGVHFITDFIGSVTLSNIAVIMAGGRGTRLGEITKNVPKPMLRVAGRPILEHLIMHLVSSGINHIYLAVNHLSEIIEDYFKDGNLHGCRIDYLREEQPLGSAGALSLLSHENMEPFLLLNGDLITQFNVESILKRHELKNSKITIGVHDHVIKVPYGVLNIKNDYVESLIEKPQKHYTINAGVYVINPELLSVIPKEKPFYATDLIDYCLSSGLNVGYHLLEGDWLDIGMHDQLKEARGL